MKRMTYLLALLVLAALPTTSSAQWEYYPRTDPFTDSDNSFVMDIQRVSGRVIAAAFKCEEGRMLFKIGHPYLMGNRDDDIEVTVRIDSNPAIGPHYWPLQPRHENAYATPERSAAILRQARTGRTLHLRIIDPGDGEVITASFGLAGLSAATNKLTCR